MALLPSDAARPPLWRDESDAPPLYLHTLKEIGLSEDAVSGSRAAMERLQRMPYWPTSLSTAAQPVRPLITSPPSSAVRVTLCELLMAGIRAVSGTPAPPADLLCARLERLQPSVTPTVLASLDDAQRREVDAGMRRVRTLVDSCRAQAVRAAWRLQYGLGEELPLPTEMVCSITQSVMVDPVLVRAAGPATSNACHGLRPWRDPAPRARQCLLARVPLRSGLHLLLRRDQTSGAGTHATMWMWPSLQLQPPVCAP